MNDSEILRIVGLETLLENVDNNLVGRLVLKAMAKAREDERVSCQSEINDAHESGGFSAI